MLLLLLNLLFIIAILKHYRNILDDQLDFNAYCLRRGTLRTYVDTLRLEDRIRDHPSYFEMAQLAIEVILRIFSVTLAFPLPPRSQNVLF